MIEIIIASIVIIVLMIIFVFVIFQSIVKRINQNAKKYFINKLEDYNDNDIVEKLKINLI